MSQTETKKGVFKYANEYGNIDARGKLPKGYCHVSNIKGIKMSHWLNKLNISFLKALVGFKETNYCYKPIFDGVVIANRSKNKLLTFLDQKQKEKEAEERKKETQKQKEEEKRKAEAIDKLANQYPSLDRNIIRKLVTDRTRIISRDSIGYQFGHGTKSYWNDLGFRVDDEPVGCLIRGKQLHDIYSKRSLVPKRSQKTVKQLKQDWLKKYGTRNLLLANALKIANRLQKVHRISDFYDMKDKWIQVNQSNLIEGKIARHERKTCWSCGGEGENGYEECYKCGGSGIYSSRTLYEHKFNIASQNFCFHSYVRPASLSEENGADLKHYGRPFNRSELPLPPQNLIIELIKNMMA